MFGRGMIEQGDGRLFPASVELIACPPCLFLLKIFLVNPHFRQERQFSLTIPTMLQSCEVYFVITKSCALRIGGDPM